MKSESVFGKGLYILFVCKMMIDDWSFTATCVHKIGKIGRKTFKGNEAKSNMKHHSVMPTPSFEIR